MNTKLTLSLDEQVIAKAKKYAKVHNTSVSHLVESYLGTITKDEEIELDGIVAELAGIIPDSEGDRHEKVERKYL